MSDKSSIEWCDATWNPVSGCTKVSEGCANCYAERLARRFWGERPFSDVRCHQERLNEPLRWRRSRRVFVNSMADLFHEQVPFSFIDRVFITMASARQHTFIVLTKRADRMAQYFRYRYRNAMARPWADFCFAWLQTYGNVWLGVSVEDQTRALERVPLLFVVPTPVRLVSCEPLLGPILLRPWLSDRGPVDRQIHQIYGCRGVNWVIVGGETGPGYRPMDLDWARTIRDQCHAATVPFFYKQSSAIRPGQGRMLDGRLWEEWPEVRCDQRN